MRNSLKSLALVAGLAAMAAGRADAQFVWSGCGGNLFNTCASVNISISGTNQLTMVVQNWGTYNPSGPQPSLAGSSIFTQLGLLNGSFGGTLTGLTNQPGVCAADPTCDWVFDPSMSLLNGFHAGGARCVGQGCNVNSGLNPPATSGAGNFTQVTLVFSTSGSINLTGTTFGLHGQSGPPDLINGGTCSTKLTVSVSGGTYTPNSASDPNGQCGSFNPPTETPVPEPASMILLATGLVAMGGAGIIRRRRNRKV